MLQNSTAVSIPDLLLVPRKKAVQGCQLHEPTKTTACVRTYGPGTCSSLQLAELETEDPDRPTLVCWPQNKPLWPNYNQCMRLHQAIKRFRGNQQQEWSCPGCLQACLSTPLKDTGYRTCLLWPLTNWGPEP